MRLPIFFIPLIIISVIPAGIALDENWYKSQPSGSPVSDLKTTERGFSENPLENAVGNNVKTVIHDQGTYDLSVLEYRNGWVLVDIINDGSGQRWINEKYIKSFYVTGKIEESQSQECGMEFGLLGILALVLVYYRRRR